MESLFAQVEAWLINLINKQVEPIIEKQISASFETGLPYNLDETSYITRYINGLIDTKIGHHLESSVETIIDSCIADKISYNFDISDYADEITDIVDTFNVDISNYSSEIMEIVTSNIHSELDIGEFKEAIESMADDRISAAKYNVSVEIV